ncbi:S8 family serine peptidase [Bermanella marisrubri]|uniref:Peptidase S8 and S53, subtilisin, kexin, sedolisin n=1 Tax=Bermanella marisrubri TaxID=207949 RepID=Q1N6G3_9GAMM|nr:S8 family serine peptidase [Bermanella marisrubri]EAT13629.1 peptidase S8 and S53, subtilisin, kexin, sedolisin [Oceanobacter sp. RED65] [Bermanella marisrubri]QIZ84415.1 S8 family serine peptidase [Bermanella marisrubri]
MVVRFLLYGMFLLLSACLSDSNSSQPNSPITYTVTSLGSERYQVAFKANVSEDHSGYWQFGDGYVSAGRSVNHIYYSPGQYTITYSFERDGQQEKISDTLVLEGAAQNLDVISRDLIVVDSDHNDPNQTWKRNDFEPQPITAPSKISGIMMAKGQCQTGRLCSSGDDIDRYRLQTDQPITLDVQHHTGELSVKVEANGSDIAWQNPLHLAAGLYDLELIRKTETVRYTLNVGLNESVDANSYQPGKLIIRYKNQLNPELVDISDPRLRHHKNIQQARQALQQADNVQSVSYNYWRFSRSFTQWSLSEFDIPLLWQLLPNQGLNVRVAVIDTGLSNHAELSHAYIEDGYDFISDPLQSDDGDGWDSNPFDDSDIGHGTHITGIIASQGQLTDTSIAGISPNVQIMPLRAIGRFGATSYDLIQSLLYAAALGNDTGKRPARPADIINLSLGGKDFSQIENDVIQRLSQLGIIIIAASGNQGSDTIDYPAAYPNVIAVGAHDRFGNVAPYSNSGAALDIIAPGGNCVDQTCSGGIINLAPQGFKSLTGTSMSTAFATGVLASLKSHHPHIDVADVNRLIEQGKITTSDKHTKQNGWGRLDMYKIGTLANSNIGTPTTHTRLWAPTQINYHNSDMSARLPIRLSNDVSLEMLNFSILPNDLNYELEKVNNYLYELSVQNAIDIDNITIRYHDGYQWRTLETQLQSYNDGHRVDFLDHLYVQIDSKRTPLRASTNQTGWQLQYPHNANEPSIQVSSDIDYDGVYCELGEFCGQRTGCSDPIARSFTQCNGGDLKSPLSGQLIISY